MNTVHYNRCAPCDPWISNTFLSSYTSVTTMKVLTAFTSMTSVTTYTEYGITTSLKPFKTPLPRLPQASATVFGEVELEVLQSLAGGY